MCTWQSEKHAKEKKNKMNDRKRVEKIKEELARMSCFRQGCAICHCKLHPKGMTFHHIKYLESDKVHSDFAPGYKGMLQYYEYLRPVIRQNPKRFAYLCNPHHQTVTRLLRFKKDKQERIFRLVRRSRQ
ncbi:MAG: hypothetical protein OEL84_01675 [Nitrosopumilus sp.]|nr:hypothetical protein [Nitrosopumilus sp.]